MSAPARCCRHCGEEIQFVLRMGWLLAGPRDTACPGNVWGNHAPVGRGTMGL